jgi:hypothetical protein
VIECCLTLQGLCHQLAEEKGLSHAQLPLDQFLKMSTRKVLTINHGQLLLFFFFFSVSSFFFFFF